MSAIVYVCTTCASTWQNGQRVGTSGGEVLLATLQQNSLDQDFTIAPVQCMSACSHACCVAFVAPGKYSYLFGELHPQVAADILYCAQLYCNKPDGMLPWGDRPESLQKTLMARLPASGF